MMKWYSSCKLCSNMHELLRYCCCSNDSVLSTVHFSPTRTFSHCCDSRTVAQVAAQWRAIWWSWDHCTLTPRECTSPALCYVAVGCTHTHCSHSAVHGHSAPHCIFGACSSLHHILSFPASSHLLSYSHHPTFPLYHYFSCSLLLPSSFLSPYLPSPSPLHISRTINETVPTLIRNPNAWNKVANVLFCECTHENVIHLCHN